MWVKYFPTKLRNVRIKLQKTILFSIIMIDFPVYYFHEIYADNTENCPILWSNFND